MNISLQKIKIFVAVVILGIIAAVGIWLGEFGWFGGNVSTKENMAIVACILGFVGSGLICQKRWLSLLTVPLYLTVSQAIFIVGIALGQTWYFSPLRGEFNETFCCNSRPFVALTRRSGGTAQTAAQPA